MKALCKLASVLALSLVAGAAMADQTIVGIVGSSQLQLGGFGQNQAMEIGKVSTSPFGAFRSAVVIGGQYNQVQGGTNNAQLMRVGVIAPTANPFAAHATNVFVLGTVAQAQGGFFNTQRTDIGVIQ